MDSPSKPLPLDPRLAPGESAGADRGGTYRTRKLTRPEALAFFRRIVRRARQVRADRARLAARPAARRSRAPRPRARRSRARARTTARAGSDGDSEPAFVAFEFAELDDAEVKDGIVRALAELIGSVKS